MIFIKDALISQYINRLNYKDIDDFAKSHGITLKNNEIEIVYNHIKKDWRTIIYGNPRGILDDIKNQFDSLTYSKIESLYTFFRNKYQNQL